MSNKLTLRDALQLAIRQNEHDMVLTGEELRACNAALASQAEAEKQCATCGFVGQEDPVNGFPKCGFDDMRAKAAEHRDGRLSALEDVVVLRGERGVLVRLLVEADKVLSTLEGESTEEQEMLEWLRRQILASTAQHRPQESAPIGATTGCEPMDQLTVDDALKLLADRAQWCRENGESDMRSILNTARGIKSMIAEGQGREEIMTMWGNDDDEDEDA